MALIYFNNVIAFELMVFAFVIVFQMIPVKFLIEKKAELQLAGFTIALVITGISYFLVDGVSSESLFDKEWIKIAIGWYGIWFLCSVYKMSSVMKSEEPVEFMLNPDEYAIGKKIDYDPMIDLTNVKAYAVSGNNIFVFSGGVPQEGDKIAMRCQKLADNIYECLSFEVLEGKLTFPKVYNTVFNWLIVAASMSMPILLVLNDIYYAGVMGVNFWLKLLESAAMFTFGGLWRNVFKGSDGIVGKAFGKLGYVLIAVAIINLFN